MAVVEGTEVSPVPWFTPDEFDEAMERTLEGDGDALRSLFFGPAPTSPE